MFTNHCLATSMHVYLGDAAAPGAVHTTVERHRWGQRALAKTALLRRDFSQAKRLIDDIAKKANDRKDLPAYASALNESAFVHTLMGKTEVAANIYRQVHDIWRSLRIERNSVGFNDYMFFLWDYAVFLRNQGNPIMAQRIESKLERSTIGTPMTYINFSRAERLADRGQFVFAEQFYEDAFVAAGQQRDVNMQLRIADRLAPVYQVTGKSHVAESLIEERSRLNRARYHSMFGDRV